MSAWHLPETSAYGKEVVLEGLLEELIKGSPGVLSGLADGVVVVRQFPLPSGRKVDLVGVDANGEILIVECKLDKNSEAKKTVVGQVLWYASEVAALSPADFLSAFEKRLGFPKPSLVAFEDDEFLAGLTKNLADGAFQLLVMVDHINRDLEHIIQYLSEHLSPGVSLVALELAYSKQGPVEMLIPTVFGKELSPPSTENPRKPWTVERLRQRMQGSGLDPAVKERVSQLIDWCDARGARFNPGQSTRVGISFDVEGKSTTVLMISADPPTLHVLRVPCERRGERRGDRDIQVCSRKELEWSTHGRAGRIGIDSQRGVS